MTTKKTFPCNQFPKVINEMKKEETNIINIEPANNREIAAVQIKIALKRILMDYEEQMRGTDPTFDVYNEIQNELGEGYSEATVRKWVNTNNNELPKINQLVTVSKFIKNRRAIDVTIAYLQSQAEGLK